MSRFRRQKHEVPGLNLAAMPDLIFTVLFFFMIVTHMRVVKPMVQTQVPQGTELEQSARKSSVVYLFIGKPVDDQGRVVSEESRIQLNDRYVTLGEIGAAVSDARAQMSDDDREHMVVVIRADRTTEMGIINDVKQELRKCGALSINYTADKKANKSNNPK